MGCKIPMLNNLDSPDLFFVAVFDGVSKRAGGESVVSESDSPSGSISTLVVITSGLSSMSVSYNGRGSLVDREENEPVL